MLTLSAPILTQPGFMFGVTSNVTVKRRMTAARIQETVAGFYHIPLTSMTGKGRYRRVARPRQVAMYLTRQLTGKSLPHIGALFGNRDHTTVIHAIHQVEHLMEIDGDFAVDVDVLRGRLG